MTTTTKTLKIHHATAKKAAKAGISLNIVDGEFIAVDENSPDQEYAGTDAAVLLAHVLSLRADTGSEDEEETEGNEPEEGEEDLSQEETIEEEVEDDEPEDEPTGSKVKEHYKITYELLDGTCGDPVAEAFSSYIRREKMNKKGDKAIGFELDYEALLACGTANGVDVTARWGDRNRGMQRMNLSNVLRGMLRNGEQITIGEQVFVPTPKTVEPKAEAAVEADPVVETAKAA